MHTEWLFLDLQGLGGSCSIPMTFYDDFMARCLVMPSILLACIVGFNHAIRYLEEQGHLDRWRAKASGGQTPPNPRASLSPVSEHLVDGTASNVADAMADADAETAPSSSDRARRRWKSAGHAVIKKILHRRQLQRGAIEVAAFCYMPASQRAMALCFCQQVEGSYYLSTDYSVKCFEDARFWFAFSSAMVVLFVWTLGFPSIIIATGLRGATSELDSTNSRLARKKDSAAMLKSKRFGILSRLQAIFRPERRYWYGWLVLRRVLLAAIFLLGQLDLDLGWGEDTERSTPEITGERDRSAASWSTASFFVLTCSVLIQEWLKPFRLAVDNLLEQCTLILLMTVLYIDIASPNGDIVSLLVDWFVYLIMLAVTVRVIGPKYVGKLVTAFGLLQRLPCCRKTTVSEMEEGLYTSADALVESQDNALHLMWGANGGSNSNREDRSNDSVARPPTASEQRDDA